MTFFYNDLAKIINDFYLKINELRNCFSLKNQKQVKTFIDLLRVKNIFKMIMLYLIANNS